MTSHDGTDIDKELDKEKELKDILSGKPDGASTSKKQTMRFLTN